MHRFVMQLTVPSEQANKAAETAEAEIGAFSHVPFKKSSDGSVGMDWESKSNNEMQLQRGGIDLVLSFKTITILVLTSDFAVKIYEARDINKPMPVVLLKVYRTAGYASHFDYRKLTPLTVVSLKNVSVVTIQPIGKQFFVTLAAKDADQSFSLQKQ